VTASRSLTSRFTQTFGNVTVGVTFLAIWGVLTIIGVIVQQNLPSSDYFDAYPAPIARAILRMNFDDIYHSVWYLASIGLVLVSMTTATFTKVIPRRLPPLRPVKVDAMPLHAHVTVKGDEATVRSRVESFFAGRGFNIRRRAFDGTEWSFADRFNWARIGVLVNHLAVLIIAAGAIVYWVRGFAGETAILTGQSTEIPHTGAIVRLDGFNYEIQPIMTKGGIVNHPIDIDGTLLYQSTYGFGMTFNVSRNGTKIASLSKNVISEANEGAPFGDLLQLPGTNRGFVYQRFVPTVDPRTQMPSADPRVANPGVILTLEQNGEALGAVLVSLHRTIDLGDGWSVTPEHYVLYSGFQYRYDPGVPLVGLGAGLLLIGLVISFYFLPARFHVRVDPAGEDACTVGLAATTVKGYDIFESQFRDLVSQLGTEVR
jgi:cytochrome c biogenesis protein